MGDDMLRKNGFDPTPFGEDKSLYESDFPKRYLTVLTMGEGYESRRNGTEAALKLNTKWILQSDNDCHVPPKFWKEMVDVAESDSHIGQVQPWVNYPAPPKEGVTDIERGNGYDGFCLFRPSFLKETGIRDGIYLAETTGTWRTVVAPVTISHDKGSPISWRNDSRENIVLEEHSLTPEGSILKLRNTEATPIALTTCYVFTENSWRIAWDTLRNPIVIFRDQPGEVKVPVGSQVVKFLTSRNNQFQFKVASDHE